MTWSGPLTKREKVEAIFAGQERELERCWKCGRFFLYDMAGKFAYPKCRACDDKYRGRPDGSKGIFPRDLPWEHSWSYWWNRLLGR